MNNGFVLKGDLCYSLGMQKLQTREGAYLVCEEGICRGVFETLPEKYRGLPIEDHGSCLVLPGLVDLHIHAPQYAFWGLGMDLELIEWLNRHAFPEESKYRDLSYAEKAYRLFIEDMRKGPNTRASVFATCHVPATLLLMDLLEGSGLVTFVGKVNMDRNSAPGLQEGSAEASLRDTEEWLRQVLLERRYSNTSPILTPRFAPSCTDALMAGLERIGRKYDLPLQSHLSENQEEVEWVKSLYPGAGSYSEVYRAFGIFGGSIPTIMAHCVWMGEEEIELMRGQRVFAAHCPQSNMNLASGVAPVRKFLDLGIPTGLGSDVAGGCHSSIFRAMTDAIQASKLYWRLTDQGSAPLTLEEAFYMGTLGGGAFFGKVGSFIPGYELDALVIDDSRNAGVNPMDLPQRLARAVYQPEKCDILKKYVRGRNIL